MFKLYLLLKVLKKKEQSNVHAVNHSTDSVIKP